MKKLALTMAVSTATVLLSFGAQADKVKGGAKADFDADELIVPCVAIEGYSEAADGTYFDIILDRRGQSFNYELKFAEPEDASVCEDIANYAEFVDDDPVDDDSASDDDSSDDGDSGSDDGGDVANLFASCEVTHVEAEQTRSKAKVEAKDLTAGDYYAMLTSGDNSVQSETRTIEGDEVEIKFDSDSDAMLEGAEAIEAGFIVDQSMTAELVNATTEETVLSETVSCLVNNG